jgi:predicted Zn-dependent protease
MARKPYRLTMILAFNRLPCRNSGTDLPPSATERYGKRMTSGPVSSLKLGTIRPWCRIRFCAGTVLIFYGTLAGSAQSRDTSDGATARQQAADPDTLLQRGFQLHQQGRFAESIPVLEQARRLAPGDYFANLLLGIDLLRSGQAKEAIPRLKQASLARPGEEFPEDYLAEAEASLGNDALAAEAYRRALLRGHDSEQTTIAWAGFALERFRQIGESLRASEQGLEVARRIQASAGNSARSETKNCETSIPELERRLAIKPQKPASPDTDVRYKLSICYATAAGQAAERLQDGAGDKAAAFRLRGDVLLRLKGDGAAAQDAYNKALVSEPKNPALLERLAEAQLSTGDTESARRSAKAALEIDSHQRDALRTLAALAMNDRDYERALPMLRQLAVEAPGDQAVDIQLGRALVETGEPTEALKWLAPVLATGYPDEKGSSHALLARVLRKLGRESEAAKAEAESRRLSDAYQARSHATDEGQPTQIPSASHQMGTDAHQ